MSIFVNVHFILIIFLSSLILGFRLLKCYYQLDFSNKKTNNKNFKTSCYFFHIFQLSVFNSLIKWLILSINFLKTLIILIFRMGQTYNKNVFSTLRKMILILNIFNYAVISETTNLECFLWRWKTVIFSS